MADPSIFPSWLTGALQGVANGSPLPSVPNVNLGAPLSTFTNPLNAIGQAATSLAQGVVNAPPFPGPPPQNAPGGIIGAPPPAQTAPGLGVPNLGGLTPRPAPALGGLLPALAGTNANLYAQLRGDPAPTTGVPGDPDPLHRKPVPSILPNLTNLFGGGGAPPGGGSPAPSPSASSTPGSVTVQIQTPFGTFPVTLPASQLAGLVGGQGGGTNISIAAPTQGATSMAQPTSPGGTGANANYTSPFANMPASNLGFSQMGGQTGATASPFSPSALPNAQPVAGAFGGQPTPLAQAGQAQVGALPNASPFGAPAASAAAPFGQQISQAAASTGATPNQTYEAELIAAMINGQQVSDSSGRVIADFTSLPTPARQAILTGLMQSSSAVQSTGGQPGAAPAPSFGAPPSGLLPPAQPAFPQQAAPSSAQPQFTPPAQPGGTPGFVNPTPTGLLPSPQQATGTNLPFTPTSSAIQPFSPTGTSSSSSTTSASAAATANQIAQQLALTHPQLYQQTQGFQNFFATPAGQSGYANVPGYGTLPIQALMSSKGSILAGPFLAAHLDSLARKGQIPPAQDLVGGGGAAGQTPFQAAPSPLALSLPNSFSPVNRGATLGG